MAGVATCKSAPHTFVLPLITPQTKVVRDLFQPVSGNVFSGGDANIFQSGTMLDVGCDVEGFATLHAYSLSDRIFRISVVYTRCKTFAASGECLEVDETERPYDRDLYDSLEHKDAYPLSTEGSFYNVYRELRSDRLIKDYIDGMSCGPWVSDFVFNRNRVDRCIVDATLIDRQIAATTVFEIFDKGYFSNTLVGRYAGTRTFIDINAEQTAIDEIVRTMTEYVVNRQAQIAESDTKLRDRTNRINELLGTRK